jgi:hypothetical protein
MILKKIEYIYSLKVETLSDKVISFQDASKLLLHNSEYASSKDSFTVKNAFYDFIIIFRLYFSGLIFRKTNSE